MRKRPFLSERPSLFDFRIKSVKLAGSKRVNQAGMGGGYTRVGKKEAYIRVVGRCTPWWVYQPVHPGYTSLYTLGIPSSLRTVVIPASREQWLFPPPRHNPEVYPPPRRNPEVYPPLYRTQWCTRLPVYRTRWCTRLPTYGCTRAHASLSYGCTRAHASLSPVSLLVGVEAGHLSEGKP